ncbi:MAG TPA: ABC transporter transmembrane domain-containing protein, partial [Burkholderiaceae bacterium]|nr:ABC transporter transmembrane domain-containing protein [Burkholderiaceae bacterium]
MKSSSQTVDAKTAPVKFDLWRRIYGRLGKYWKAVVLAIVLVSISAATQPTLAIITKPLLDEGFTGAKPYYVWAIPLAVIGLILLRGITSYTSAYLLAWVANNMLLGIRRDMFDRLLGMSDEDYKRSDTGRLLNRFTIDAGNVTEYATEVITVLVRESLVVLALLVVLLYMSWQLTLIVLVVMPVSVYTARLFIRRLRSINRDTISMNA